MRRIKYKAFTIIELLVVLAIIGIFSAIAYPNVSSWITDREVKKEVYDVVSYLNERKSEVVNGKYGMVQVVLNTKIHTYTMSTEDFINEYKSINSSTIYKINKVCDHQKPSSFKHDTKLDLLIGSRNNESNVHVFPSTNHPYPTSYSIICITKDGSIKYMRNNVNEPDRNTGKNVDYFMFCSKNNATAKSCKNGAKFDSMYKITWDRFVNIKIYKYNKKGKWILQDA